MLDRIAALEDNETVLKLSPKLTDLNVSATGTKGLRLYNYDENTANAPTTSWGLVFIVEVGNRTLVEYAHAGINTKIYMRGRVNSDTWGAWKSITFS